MIIDNLRRFADATNGEIVDIMNGKEIWNVRHEEIWGNLNDLKIWHIPHGDAVRGKIAGFPFVARAKKDKEVIPLSIVDLGGVCFLLPGVDLTDF